VGSACSEWYRHRVAGWTVKQRLVPEGQIDGSLARSASEASFAAKRLYRTAQGFNPGSGVSKRSSSSNPGKRSDGVGSIEVLRFVRIAPA
jgi:hypothetical protein